MERGRQSWSLPCRCSAFASVGTLAAFRPGCAARAPVQCPVARSACVVTRCLRQLELTFADSGEPWSEARERGRFPVSSYASDVPVSPGLRRGVDFTATSPGSGVTVEDASSTDRSLRGGRRRGARGTEEEIARCQSTCGAAGGGDGAGTVVALRTHCTFSHSLFKSYYF